MDDNGVPEELERLRVRDLEVLHHGLGRMMRDGLLSNEGYIRVRRILHVESQQMMELKALNDELDS